MKMLYVDLDNTLVNLKSGIDQTHPDDLNRVAERDEIPGIFSQMAPMPGAIEAFIRLSTHFDAYILSTAPWMNPLAWTEKLLWVQRYFGSDEASPAYKRLILSHHKNLNCGDFLVDDRPGHRGVDKFEGEVIPFAQKPYEDWGKVEEYLMQRTGSSVGVNAP